MAWDFYINGQGRCVGTVVSRTHDGPTLIKALNEELSTVTLRQPDIGREAQAWLCTAVDWQSVVWDDRPEVQDAQDEDLGAWYHDRGHALPNELMDALDNLAPEGYRFGAHEGDGADFGWWKVDDCDD